MSKKWDNTFRIRFLFHRDRSHFHLRHLVSTIIFSSYPLRVRVFVMISMHVLFLRNANSKKIACLWSLATRSIDHDAFSGIRPKTFMMIQTPATVSIHVQLLANSNNHEFNFSFRERLRNRRTHTHIQQHYVRDIADGDKGYQPCRSSALGPVFLSSWDTFVQ